MKRTATLLLAAAFAICFSVNVFAAGNLLYLRSADYTYDSSLSRVVDEAELLSNSEKELLQARIDDIVSAYHFDVVILTVSSIGGKSVEQFADDYYDYNNFGYGENADGILFMLNMGGRDYYTSTSGRGIEVFTDYGIEYIGEKIVGRLSDGRYFDAFSSYLDYVENYLENEQSGNPAYDINEQLRENPFKINFNELIIFLTIGFILSLITVNTMKNKMNTANPKSCAQDYVNPDSFNLTSSDDRFLFRTTTRVKVEKNTSASRGAGGSSTHTGSSGRAHGGGGGKF